jgi:hypothetical protein
MCLVIATWNEKLGTVASEGRMMMHSAAPVAFGQVPKQVAADDVFKVHRLTPSLVVGIVGWAHVADELLTYLRAVLIDYCPEIVTARMVWLKKKYPTAALQALLMGVRDGKVCAAAWSDADPAHPITPVGPLNRRVLVLGDSEIAQEAVTLTRRDIPLKSVFESLATKYTTINANVREEHVHD